MVTVSGLDVLTTLPFFVQFLNLYPSLGMAVSLTFPPSLTFSDEATAVPPVFADADTV